MARKDIRKQKLLCLGGMALLLFMSSLVTSSAAYAQNASGRDSLIRLLDAATVRLVDNAGKVFREVGGPAKFLHNDTYLICDSAVWNVDENIIEAIGNVKIIQQDTYLVGDRLTYYPEENLAQFRGSIVRLYNSKGDQLKTKYLDYDTRDSVATFFNGGAMRSANGDIVEGNSGTYESESGIFRFEGMVDMYSDSLFVSSNRVRYDSRAEKAYFLDRTTAFHGEDTLYTDSGEYSRRFEILSIRQNNYIATRDQELWGRIVYYYRNSGNAELFSDVQIRDNAQSMVLVGEIGIYKADPMRAFMTDRAGAAMYSEERTGTDSLASQPVVKRDTLFLSGDTLMMRLTPMFEIDSSVIAAAEERRMLADKDPMVAINKANEDFLAAYRRNKANAGKPVPPAKPNPAAPAEPEKPSGPTKPTNSADAAVPDTPPAALRDSLSVVPGIASDTLSVSLADTVATRQDSTKILFLDVHRNVRIYRSDLRGSCDSLVYTSIDSIARFYKEPVFWDGEKTQFSADSIQLSIRNNAVHKANLIENAFIISQEDSIHFDQIKSTEMVAYFKDNNVYRFDAIGGANVMAFIKERDSVVTLMNQKECKLLTARMKDRTIQRIRYIENLKSDVRPTYNMPLEMMRLRNFRWRMDEMPTDRREVVQAAIRPSERGRLSSTRFPRFRQTELYFEESYQEIKVKIGDIDRQIRLKRGSARNSGSAPDYGAGPVFEGTREGAEAAAER